MEHKVKHMNKIEIYESTKKKIPFVNFAITISGKLVFKEEIKGKDYIKKLNVLRNSHQSTFDQVSQAIIYNRHSTLDYLPIFKNITFLYLSGSTVLKFPKLISFKKLDQIHIDNFSKPTSLINLRTSKNLRELWIGSFTFNGPVMIESFDEIVNCKKLEKLVLSNSKFQEEELKKIIKMKSLKELIIHQKIETSTLAFLAAKLPKLKSNELKAWQKVPENPNQIKINGKRKPYLDIEKDKLKIGKYELEFEKLIESYAP